jgi:hypothetical protein
MSAYPWSRLQVWGSQTVRHSPLISRLALRPNEEPKELLYDRPIEHCSNHFRNSWPVIIFPPPILVFLMQVRHYTLYIT